MKNLTKAVRRSLDKGEITMTDLAGKAGCSRQHLYGAIAGEHQISLPLAEKLAKAIGYEVVVRKKQKRAVRST